MVSSSLWEVYYKTEDQHEKVVHVLKKLYIKKQMS